MATNSIGGSPSPVTFPNPFSTFDRGTIASAVEVLVAVLDAMDGDPDQEDAADAEDDFSLSPVAQALASDGPGCEISDPDFCAVERGDSTGFEMGPVIERNNSFPENQA